MIKGVHTMFYTSQPAAMRAFFRDKLGLAFTDVGEGWLIFEVFEADLGCHPADVEKGAPSGTPSISFYCDDIEKTMADLKARGVEFATPIEDHGYGLVTFFKVPGDFTIQLYQPRYVKNPKMLPPPIAAPAPTPKPVPVPAPPKRPAKPKPAPAKAKAPARKPAPAKRAVAKAPTKKAKRR